MESSLNKKVIAECLGTTLLLTIVVGSGIMGEQLSQGNSAIALLINALSTGAGLIILILMLESQSGAHFNPLVSILNTLRGNISKKIAALYIVAQIGGAILGVALAHLMFEKELFSFSDHIRSGSSQWLSEFVATFELIAVIRGVERNNKRAVPYAVGLYIFSAYFFTSSTAFANPAVTLARALTPTFAGIRPTDVLMFLLAQVSGAFAADFLFRYFEAQPNFKKE